MEYIGRLFRTYFTRVVCAAQERVQDFHPANLPLIFSTKKLKDSVFFFCIKSGFPKYILFCPSFFMLKSAFKFALTLCLTLLENNKPDLLKLISRRLKCKRMLKYFYRCVHPIGWLRAESSNDEHKASDKVNHFLWRS